MNVAVLGAGPRAREVARICAQAGEHVRLLASDATAVMDSIDVVERQLDDASGAAYDHLEGTTDLERAVTDAQIVIDTTCQSPEELQERVAEVEALVEPTTLIATAVPEVSVTAAAAGLRHPDRAVGFLFHRPEEPFVEVVLPEGVGADAVERAEAFAEGVAAEWVTVRDIPGAVSTRLALALEVAAIRMLDEGVAGVDAVDRAFKHRYETELGPLEHADRVGLDNRRETLLALSGRLGARFEPPPLLTARVEAGLTGIDVGEGFYVWEDGQPVHGALADPTRPAEDER